MAKEYKTIREVAGPLMMVSDVENVKYDELGEIELPNGETRRCRVLEVNGNNALLQLFESSAGINPYLPTSPQRKERPSKCTARATSLQYSTTSDLRSTPVIDTCMPSTFAK